MTNSHAKASHTKILRGELCMERGPAVFDLGDAIPCKQGSASESKAERVPDVWRGSGKRLFLAATPPYVT